MISALEQDCRRHGTISPAEMSLALKRNIGEVKVLLGSGPTLSVVFVFWRENI